MLAAMRQQLKRGSAPPSWVTTSPLIDGAWGDSYSTTLVAVGSPLPIGYGVQSGALPPGLTLGTYNGVLSGTPQPDPNAPVWTTAAGSLGTVNQGAVFTSTLVAPSAAGFTVSGGVMPWGLTLNVATGVVGGTVAITGGAYDPPTDAPVWSTPAGSLGTIRTAPSASFFPVSISLAATGAATFDVADGKMPWGLQLALSTGAISGSALDVGSNGVWEPDTTITWSAPASTDLGSFARGASVGPIAQTASPAGVFYEIGGGLPWGLTIVRGSGAIGGTVSAENAPGVYSVTIACASLLGEAFGQRTYSITIT